MSRRNETSLRRIANPGDVCRIEYTSCDGRMQIIACDVGGEHWYLIADDRRRQRWVRLFRPSALLPLLNSYGYLDSNGCLNRDRGVVHRGPRHRLEGPTMLDRLTSKQRATTGVPQRAHNSGVCWYCAMCFVMLFTTQMRRLLRDRAPPVLKRLLGKTLTDKDTAERLRHHLYHTYALGDKPGQDPALDGQNGFAQLCILLHHLDVPVVRLFAPDMEEITDKVRDQRKRLLEMRREPRAGETSLLVVRAFRTKWTPKARLVWQGRRYKLVGALIGSEHCGHQIGASALDIDDCATWALSDSDATQHGIGPLFWSVRRRKGEATASFRARWQGMWSDMVPATIFGGNQVCDLNPVNRPTRELERHERITDEAPDTPGVVNTDFIYMHIP